MFRQDHQTAAFLSEEIGARAEPAQNLRFTSVRSGVADLFLDRNRRFLFYCTVQSKKGKDKRELGIYERNSLTYVTYTLTFHALPFHQSW